MQKEEIMKNGIPTKKMIMLKQRRGGRGDHRHLILYQGDAFVIYCDTNLWNFTRLGKISDVTGEELKEILGNGDVTVVLSLNGKEQRNGCKTDCWQRPARCIRT